jgi:hypothetical protein
VLTADKLNVAPYSFFIVVSYAPYQVVLSVRLRDECLNERLFTSYRQARDSIEE